MRKPIPYPCITAVTPEQQLQQLRSYLYLLVGELNAALEQLEGGSRGSNQI